MRKLFLKSMLLLCALIVGSSSLWADNYTITFATNSGDGTAATTSTACSTVVSAGSSYLSGNLVTATKVYYAGSDGLKLGASNNAGVIKMNLAATVKPTSIVVNAKLYNSSKAATIAANGKTAQNLTADFANYTFTFDGNTDVTFIQLNSSKYCWVSSVTVNYSAGGTTTSDLALTGSTALEFDLYDNADAKVINYTTSSTGNVTVTASEYISAEVNESTKTITVTPLKKTASDQTITVNQEADATYAAGSQTFTVSIDDSTPPATFEKITSADDLATGDELIFVYESGEKAAGTIGSNSYLAHVDVDIESAEIEVVNGDGVNVFVLGGESGAWTFYSKLDDGYLYSSAAKSVGIHASEAAWSISINSTNATITANSLANNNLQYNAASPRFCAYTSTQSAIQIYRKVVDRTKVTVGSTGYTTYVTKGKVAFPVGVTAYIATAASGSAITLQSVASAPANTAVVIQASAGNYDLTDEDSPYACTGNILKASDGYKKGNGTSIYALGNKSAGVGFYLVENDATIPAGKAYLVYPENNNAPSMLRFVEEETGATNIDATKAVEEGVKFIENGKLFIKKNGVVYDMLGTVVR